jgi:hypothetical protein
LFRAAELRLHLGFVQKIVLDIFADHVARIAHRVAQVRQHEADTGADVGHRAAGFQIHRVDDVARPLPLLAGGIANPFATLSRPSCVL